MSTHIKSEKIATFPAPATSGAKLAKADLITFAEGDLGKIQDILFRDPSRQIERRLHAIEADYQLRLEKMEKLFSQRLDELTQANSEKVSQAKLAKILSALADEVPDA